MRLSLQVGDKQYDYTLPVALPESYMTRSHCPVADKLANQMKPIFASLLDAMAEDGVIEKIVPSEYYASK